MILNKVKYCDFIVLLLVGLIIWLSSFIKLVSVLMNVWYILVIFVVIIIGCIMWLLLIVGVVIIGLILIVLLGIVFMDIVVVGFGSSMVWMIVMVYFMLCGFINIGLG